MNTDEGLSVCRSATHVVEVHDDLLLGEARPLAVDAAGPLVLAQRFLAHVEAGRDVDLEVHGAAPLGNVRPRPPAVFNAVFASVVHSYRCTQP